MNLEERHVEDSLHRPIDQDLFLKLVKLFKRKDFKSLKGLIVREFKRKVFKSLKVLIVRECEQIYSIYFFLINYYKSSFVGEGEDGRTGAETIHNL